MKNFKNFMRKPLIKLLWLPFLYIVMVGVAIVQIVIDACRSDIWEEVSKVFGEITTEIKKVFKELVGK